MSPGARDSTPTASPPPRTVGAHRDEHRTGGGVPRRSGNRGRPAHRFNVPLTNGDGILLRARELIVVQNQLNQLAVLRLSPDLSRRQLRTTLTDSDFDVPTTVAAFGRSLYVVNAKFGTTPTPTTPYQIVKVRSVNLRSGRPPRLR